MMLGEPSGSYDVIARIHGGDRSGIGQPQHGARLQDIDVPVEGRGIGTEDGDHRPIGVRRVPGHLLPGDA